VRDALVHNGFMSIIRLQKNQWGSRWQDRACDTLNSPRPYVKNSQFNRPTVKDASMPIHILTFHEFQRACERMIISISQNAPSPSYLLARTTLFCQKFCMLLQFYLPPRYATRFDALCPPAQPITSQSLQSILPSLKAEWMMLNVVSIFLVG
jgi:hypothetical protein